MDEAIIDLLLQEEPGQAVLNALQRLLDEDMHLMQVDANERSLTHRVAIYLQQEWPEWHVDCEYNRDKHEPKELFLEGGDPDAYDENAQTVYPDVVVHKRGTNENYLIIEFKKTSSKVGDGKDFQKLRAFISQLNYKHALFVELQVGWKQFGVKKVEWVHS